MQPLTHSSPVRGSSYARICLSIMTEHPPDYVHNADERMPALCQHGPMQVPSRARHLETVLLRPVVTVNCAIFGPVQFGRFRIQDDLAEVEAADHSSLLRPIFESTSRPMRAHRASWNSVVRTPAP